MFLKLLKYILFSAVIFIIASVLVVVVFKWVNPSTSAFIALKSGGLDEMFYTDIPKQDWVPLNKISPYMPLAVIASEDQIFFDHFGFDFNQIEKAMKENQKRKRIRGASTISQQVAKNMFLYPGKSFIRKGIEAYFTMLIELIWGKKRILEVYLNVAEFGEGIYGVQAASRIYFHKDASALNAGEAALLTAILPSPLKRSVARPSAYVITRKGQILTQMELIGGIKFLHENIN